MKVKVASDLHLEFCNDFNHIPNLGNSDILILAGDIICARNLKKNGTLKEIYLKFFDMCSKNFNEVLYVLGNHEHFSFNYESTHKTIREYLPSNFHLLENETVTIGNWTFLGATLWTNFRNENPLEMMEAKCIMNDYKTIRITPKYRKLNPDDTLAFHKESKQYLLNQLQNLKENVFVISHHAPSYQSVAPEYKMSANGAYCSDLDDLILEHPQIKYFVHGHTHTFFDYKIGDCRVICNPAGYPGTTTGFRPDFELMI